MSEMTQTASSVLQASDSVSGVMLEARELMKRYRQRTAVNGVSFQVLHGEIFGLLGPNGAGKTTTLEMIEGIRTPDAGTAMLAGLDIRRQKSAAAEYRCDRD